MTKYFFDTEFIEGFHKPRFGKNRHFIDLISIGIIDENGRSYYAISNEFNPKDASQWVKDNVIAKLLPEQTHDDFLAKRPNVMFRKSNALIRDEIISFLTFEWIREKGKKKWFLPDNRPIQIYGYYADYDWVLLCSLFGRMVDLPDGMPMYCRDLKQMFDELCEKVVQALATKSNLAHISPSFAEISEKIKGLPEYPKQDEDAEHNALEDAKWNKALYDFIVKWQQDVIGLANTIDTIQCA